MTASSHRHDVAQCIFCDSYIINIGGKLIPLLYGSILLSGYTLPSIATRLVEFTYLLLNAMPLVLLL